MSLPNWREWPIDWDDGTLGGKGSTLNFEVDKYLKALKLINITKLDNSEYRKSIIDIANKYLLKDGNEI